MTPEDKVALKMVDKNTKHDSHRYEVAIPWKKLPGTCLLNNQSNAEEKPLENQLIRKQLINICQRDTLNWYIVQKKAIDLHISQL